MLFGFIDTNGITKDIDYIVTEVKWCIVGVAQKIIIQVYFDNVVAMKNVASNISHEWPLLEWAHLNLLLKDWRNNNVNDIVDKAKDVVKYIWTHQ